MKAKKVEYIGAGQAASLWNVCEQRARAMLRAGKIKGAYKNQKGVWMVPIEKKMPKVTPGTRGPKGRWQKRPRTAETIILVNRKRIDKNKKNQRENNGKPCQPVLSVKQGTRRKRYGHEVQIEGPCKLIYRPNDPLDCGATVWIEADPSIEILCKEFITQFQLPILGAVK